MNDREKVIQELADSLKNQHCGFIDGVGDVYAVSEETIKNIIALLKDQQQIINSLKSDLQETLEVVSEQSNVVRCKDCKYAHKTYDGDCKYCDMFTDDYGNPIKHYLSGEWFCADGERRDEDAAD